jgi:replicative DNA helicase
MTRQSERPALTGPHDLDAERAVLGACLLSAAAVAEVREIISAEDFYRPAHANVFLAVGHLDDHGEAVDAITVHAALVSLGLSDGIGVSNLVDLAAGVPVTSSPRKYASIVAELARKRRLAGAGQEITEAALDPTRDAGSVLSEAESRLVIAGGETTDEHRPVDVAEVVDLALARADAADLRGGGLSGLTSGYRDLDDLEGGMEPGQLYVAAARSGMGKTSFVLGMLLSNIKREVPSLLFSLEMSQEEIGARLLAMEASISSAQQRSGRLSAEQWTRLYEARDRLATFPLVVDDRSSPTLSEIRLAAKAMRSKRGLGLVVLDYLQLVAGRSDAEHREVEVRETAEGLKAIAKDFGCVVVAAAQINRKVEDRHDKRPLLSDLRESGGIEQAADVVAFLYRDDYYNPASPDAGTAEVIVRKNRSGPTGTVKLAWLASFTRFADLSFSYSGGPS